MSDQPLFGEILAKLKKVIAQISEIKESQLKGKATHQQMEDLKNLESYLEWFNKVNLEALQLTQKQEGQPTAESIKENDQIKDITNNLMLLKRKFSKNIEEEKGSRKKKEHDKKIRKRQKKFKRLGGDDSWIPL